MTEQLRNFVAEVINDAGGQVVGRTRLQKIFFMLEVTGYGKGFRFGYKHYGPYSPDLTSEVQLDILLGTVDEKKEKSKSGRRYSVFTSKVDSPSGQAKSKETLLSIMQSASSIELELAATAVLLFHEGFEAESWAETARRKPDKAADGRLEKAKALLEEISAIETPNPIPSICA
jgi:uncharacterized protein YwgA